MNKFLILLTLGCIHLCSYSQDFHVTLSQPLRTYSSFGNFMPAANGFVSATTTAAMRNPPIYYRMTLDRFGIALQKYDTSLQIVKTNLVGGGDQVFGPFPPQIRYLGDKLCLVYYKLTFDKENSSLAVFIAPIDTATLGLVHPVKLFEYQHRNYGMIHTLKAMGTHPPVFNSSTDGSRFIACWNTGSDNVIRVHVLDKAIRSLWSKNQVPADSPSIQFFDGCIDDAGTVYLSYQAHPGSKHATGHVLVQRENALATDNLIRVSGGQPFEVRLAPAPGQPFIHIIGTYTVNYFLGGFFSTRINISNFSLDSVKSTPVPDTIGKKLKEDGWAITKRGNFVLKPILLQAFGFPGDRVELIGEFSEKDDLVETGWPPTIYGDILWIRLEQGKWSFHRIFKVHETSSPNDAVSMRAIKCTDKMLVFYDEAGARSDRKLVLDVARLTPAGEINKEKLIDIVADHYIPLMDLITATPGGSFLAMFNRVTYMLANTSDYRLATISLQ